MRFRYQTTVLKHPLYRCWTSGRIDDRNSCKQWSQTTVFNFRINTGRAVRIVFSGVYFLLFSWNMSFLIHATYVSHFFKTLQQDLSLMSRSWSRDQDIKTFGLKTETKTKTSNSGLVVMSWKNAKHRLHVLRNSCLMRKGENTRQKLQSWQHAQFVLKLNTAVWDHCLHEFHRYPLVQHR